MTGLAGGDHLHFTMLVDGQLVNPIEWWDEHWIQDRVVRKIAEANGDTVRCGARRQAGGQACKEIQGSEGEAREEEVGEAVCAAIMAVVVSRTGHSTQEPACPLPARAPSPWPSRCR